MSLSETDRSTIINVADIINHPGKTRTVTGDVVKLEDFEIALTAFSKPITFSLTLDVLVDGILVKGDIAATVTQQCTLCLTDIPETTFSSSVMELFTTSSQNPMAQDDGTLIAHDEIDVDPLLRDTVFAAIPQTVQCTPDCKGLCSTCGVHWNSCTCTPHDPKPTVDPRWDALRSLNLPAE